MCVGVTLHRHFHLNLTIISLPNLQNLVYLVTLKGERFITFFNFSYLAK